MEPCFACVEAFVTQFIVIVIAAIFALALFAAVAWKHKRQATFEDIAPELEFIGLEEFRVLVDPDDDSFLRAHLPKKDYVIVTRLRRRAALEYLVALDRIAVMLVQIGQAAALNSDPQIAATGTEMAQLASKCHFNALMARMSLWSPSVLSSLRPPQQVVAPYERLQVCFQRFSSMRGAAVRA
jgi:hypothetical protein